MEGYLRKYSNQTAAASISLLFSSGLQSFETLTGKPNDVMTPPWAHSCMELQKIKDPSRFLAEVICFYFPTQTLKASVNLKGVTNNISLISHASSLMWPSNLFHKGGHIV